jgi:hypothetical protein
MTDVATAAARSWWGASREPDVIATEIVGPGAIADLAAVRFDHSRLQARAAAGIRPVVDVLALRVLLAARKRPMRAADLADECRVSRSGVRRGISLALDCGALVRDERFSYRTHGAWDPGAIRTVAVELKLRDWPSALAQAQAYSQWANAAWILLALAPPANALLWAAEDGIGVAVLAPSGEVSPLLRPASKRHPPQRLAAIWATEQVLQRAVNEASPVLRDASGGSKLRSPHGQMQRTRIRGESSGRATFKFEGCVDDRTHTRVAV